MKYLIDFLEKKDIKKSDIFTQLKCSEEEALLLKAITKHYIAGREEVIVADLLLELYGTDDYNYLLKLDMIKNLLEMGWLAQQTFQPVKLGEQSLMGLLNALMTLTPSFTACRKWKPGYEFARDQGL